MLTIKELRAKEAYRLAKFHCENPSITDIQEANRLMTSFYRLCGLCERNLYLSNNERTCNSKYAAFLEEKESNWHKRLDNEFYKFAGLRLVYCGYCPSIGIITTGYGFSEKISRYFYQ